jgi:hypothetical protein
MRNKVRWSRRNFDAVQSKEYYILRSKYVNLGNRSPLLVSLVSSFLNLLSVDIAVMNEHLFAHGVVIFGVLGRYWKSIFLVKEKDCLYKA